MLTLVRLEIVLILMQDMSRFALNVPWALKSFWTHPTVLLGDEALLHAHFGLFGDKAHLDAR
jgi:hypothetical protein